MTVFLLYDTLQMSLLLRDWVSGAHIQDAEGAFWVLSVQIGTKVVWGLLHLYDIKKKTKQSLKITPTYKQINLILWPLWKQYNVVGLPNHSAEAVDF